MAQPSPTLYVHNLNDKVKTEELRTQLYALFTTYGKVIDVVASKAPRSRGQAFLVFSDLAAATMAMRACEGMPFYDKPLRIEYARSKSYATFKQHDPSFISPAYSKTPKSAAAAAAGKGVNGVAGGAEKRSREQDDVPADRQAKRGKAGDDDEDEMEIEDEDEQPPPPAANGFPVPQPSRAASNTLLCTNLPQEVTDDVLSVLFQQYQGFQSTAVVAAPHFAVVSGVTTTTKTKMAQIFYDTAELASTAKEALDGFTIKKGWKMTVQFV